MEERKRNLSEFGDGAETNSEVRMACGQIEKNGFKIL